MSLACAAMVDDGVIRGVLATVECQTRVYAESGYQALTTGSPVFQGAVTAVLTIYVALIGYRMLFGQGSTRISDTPGIALKIGLILALVTSWSAFQTLVFDVADRAPEEIAAIVSASPGPPRPPGRFASTTRPQWPSFLLPMPMRRRSARRSPAPFQAMPARPARECSAPAAAISIQVRSA